MYEFDQPVFLSM